MRGRPRRPSTAFATSFAIKHHRKGGFSMHGRKATRWAALLLFIATAALAQNNTALLEEAKAAVATAESAGAPTYAKALYDDAAYRLRFAQENWNTKRSAEAGMRALEATVAAQAA